MGFSDQTHVNRSHLAGILETCGYKKSAITDSQGQFQFLNVPFNPYHLTVSAAGFNHLQQDVVIRSTVPVELKLRLDVAASNTTVSVEAEGGDLIEAVPIAHTDVDSSLTAKLPEESLSSGLSSVIAQATPGVAADSNGFFHPQGEHADTSFSVDNQPINDQQSRVFSNAAGKMLTAILSYAPDKNGLRAD
jgi:hypothetical protein